MSPPNSFAELAQAGPQVKVTSQEAEALARGAFGLDVSAEPLAGERDQNFLLQSKAGAKFVLKVVHPDEPEPRLHFQNRALEHLSRKDPTLPVPRLVQRKNGDAGGALRLQCLTFLEGSPLHTVNPGAGLRRSVGRFQAKLLLALGEFSHPAQGLDILWDTKRLASLTDLAGNIVDRDRRALVLAAIARFEGRVAPALSSLRQQTIHNDFNRDNILIDGQRITGIIDFGDIVTSPIVQDVATACAYLASDTDAFADAIGDVAMGFHAVLPLERLEISVLPDFIMARLALIILVGSHKAKLNPGNADYLLRNQVDAVRFLARLLEQDSHRLAERLSEQLSGCMTSN